MNCPRTIRAPIGWLEAANGSCFPIQASCTLGRSVSNDVALAGEKISRRHAVIQAKESSEFWLTDLGSTNGTWLNGNRVAQPALLSDQDQIAIGTHRFVFRQPQRVTPPNGLCLADKAIDRMTELAQCWLLLARFDSNGRSKQSFAPDRNGLAPGGWLDQCRDIIEDHLGRIDRYLEDGMLACWPGEAPNRAALVEALLKLKQLQQPMQPPFRFVLHLGQVEMRRKVPACDCSLNGPGLHFVFQLDQLATSLSASRLVSESAQASLGSQMALDEAGRHPIDGREEAHLYQF